MQAKSNGLASSAYRAFSDSTTYNFIEYLISIQFRLPIGNRGPRAQTKIAELLYSQDAALLRDLYDRVVLDVNARIRKLNTNFAQIASSFESAEARDREVESIVARAERKDMNTLNSELAARRQRAVARTAMLNSMVEYNIAIIELERAKGTLLRYNNVVLPFHED